MPLSTLPPVPELLLVELLVLVVVVVVVLVVAPAPPAPPPPVLPGSTVTELHAAAEITREETAPTKTQWAKRIIQLL
jgi:hypothetical protein